MASNYPTSLDNFATNKADATSSATDHPAHHNDLADAVNKIELEMGTLPGWGPTPRTQPASRGLLMTNSILENIPRWGVVMSVPAAATAGTIRVTPLGVARAGQAISSISFFAATAGATPTALWAGIARLSDRVVLARSNNSTTLPTANALQTFTFATAYTPTADETIVGFLMTNASTQPTYYGVAVAQAFMVSTPVIAGTSNTGQSTTPLTVGATMTAFTAAGTVLYAQLR